MVKKEKSAAKELVEQHLKDSFHWPRLPIVVNTTSVLGFSWTRSNDCRVDTRKFEKNVFFKMSCYTVNQKRKNQKESWLWSTQRRCLHNSQHRGHHHCPKSSGNLGRHRECKKRLVCKSHLSMFHLSSKKYRRPWRLKSNQVEALEDGPSFSGFIFFIAMVLFLSTILASYCIRGSDRSFFPSDFLIWIFERRAGGLGQVVLLLHGVGRGGRTKGHLVGRPPRSAHCSYFCASQGLHEPQSWPRSANSMTIAVSGEAGAGTRSCSAWVLITNRPAAAPFPLDTQWALQTQPVAYRNHWGDNTCVLVCQHTTYSCVCPVYEIVYCKLLYLLLCSNSYWAGVGIATEYDCWNSYTLQISSTGECWNSSF